jgi:homoserine kinase
MEFRLRLPGSTSNLGSGFDALGMALSLYNRAHVRTRDDPEISVTVRGEGAGALPDDDTNLFVRAAREAAKKIGGPLPGFDLDLENGVPVARGLGSSATVIVGGIVAANRMLGETLSESDVLDLAVAIEGHPDNVSACLKGGLTITAVSDGRTESLAVRPVDPPRVVVAFPSFEVKTADARDALPAQVPHEDAIYNVSRASLLVAALLTGERGPLREAFNDRLHQPYRASLIAGFSEVIQAGLDAGAYAVGLSGAGPAMLALTDSAPDDVGTAMVSVWNQLDIRAESHVLDIDFDGVTTE